MSLDSRDCESRLRVLQQIRVLATALEDRDIGRANTAYQRFVDAIADACEAFDAPIVGPFELADQFQEEGDWRAAAEIYEQLLTDSHCDSIAAFRSNSCLGWIAFQLGRHSDVLRHFTAAIGSPVAEGLIPQHRSSLMVSQALAYLEMGSVSQARAVLDRVQSSSEGGGGRPTTRDSPCLGDLLPIGGQPRCRTVPTRRCVRVAAAARGCFVGDWRSRRFGGLLDGKGPIGCRSRRSAWFPAGVARGLQAL